MQQWTHREYLMRLAWLDRQWELPSRTDNYLMLIANYLAGIRGLFTRRPLKLQLKAFVLRFTESAGKEPSGSPSQMAVNRNKQTWVGRIGGKVTHKKRKE